MKSPLSIIDTYKGRHVLFTGASGFLGKVWLAQALDQLPDVGRIYVLVRGKKGQSALDRFESMINDSYAFSSLHDKHGEGLSQYLASRVEVVAGDISGDGLGIEPAVAKRLRRDLDLVIHCAGQVDFDPDLRDALRNNVDGTVHTAAFVRGCDHCAMVQVSTCFVAGNREGRIEETLRTEITPLDMPFDVEAEYRHLEQEIARVQEETVGPAAMERMRADLRERIASRGKDADNENLVERVLRRESQAVLLERMVELGTARAQHWGWPNIYTFTKAMAEAMLVKKYADVPFTIFRPAITESAVSYPLPGWNEGLNTSGPLIYFMGTWYRQLPARDDKVLDVIPVDICCASLTASGAALLQRRHSPVYQCATSHLNPLPMSRALELTSLGHRRHYRKHGDGAVERVLLSRWDGQLVDEDHFMRIENIRGLVRRVGEGLKALPKGVPAPLRSRARKIASDTERVDRRLNILEKVIDTYKPFVLRTPQVFVTSNLADLNLKERQFAFRPQDLDWRRYWTRIHLPGLRRWSFPVIENRRVESMVPRHPVSLPRPRPRGARAASKLSAGLPAADA